MLRIIGRSLVDFVRDDGLMLAGSLSYFTVMALVPFCLFLLTLLGYYLGHSPEFYRFVLDKLVHLFPSATGGVSREITKLISVEGRGAWGLILYGLLSFQVFASIERSLNRVFRVKQKRHMLFSVLASFVLVTMVIILLIFSFVAASVIPLLNALKPYLPSLKIGILTTFLVQYMIPFLLVFITATLIYKIIPSTTVPLSGAFQGGLFTALFLEIAKHCFTWYVVSVAHLGKVYGSLTAFVFFLLWMFYSACIFLVGAEVIRNLNGSKRKRGGA
ncbi:MAG: YihY/virulence factor BrkB family protein [Nitrospiraceae bacterium]|nr:YihY/virulence factor BrkB family protein [Nitrospiraceae bacterium]